VTGAFTAAMLLTVFFVARETEEAEAHGGETTTETEQPPPAPPKGNAAAGKVIFTDPSIGCFGCHTLKAANATGTVGPNLDEAKPSVELIVERVTNGKPPMPAFKGTLSPTQIDDVAAFVYESTHSP
jgi:mono/diheme cytochrome c family protein